MIKECEIVVLPQQLDRYSEIVRITAEKLRISLQKINHVELLKRSIDARSVVVKYRLQVAVFTDSDMPTKEDVNFEFKNVVNAEEIYIVGAGPAGLFAALKCLIFGYKPVIFERGKDISERKKDVALLNTQGVINLDSNYCFGEGGAGTFSDGKLYTRSNKRGNIKDVLRLLVLHGANPSILIDAHPHLGTDKLPDILKNIKNTIISHGGIIHFNTKVTDIIVENDSIVAIEVVDFSMNKQNYCKQAFPSEAKKSLRSNNNEIIRGVLKCNYLLLATGGSADDIYMLLDKKNIAIEQKQFAIGTRLEHPQKLIDKMQYHCDKRPEYLPPAEYSVKANVVFSNRMFNRNNKNYERGNVEHNKDLGIHNQNLGLEKGVFSFCMCPGGHIIPASSNEKHLVVNGMSNSSRSSEYANAGIVVTVDNSDFQQYERFANDPLAGLFFRNDLEQKFYSYGNTAFEAPAQNTMDFVKMYDNKKYSNSSASNKAFYANTNNDYLLNSTTYHRGITSANFHELLPTNIATALCLGLIDINNKKRGFISKEAQFIGLESRTSSPVRIPRLENMQHIQIKNLYPCGEGAGYAGGITSSALDGMNVVDNIISKE
ncbi:NAD(FAD)-utilizing dehydrogenase [Bacteroidia bacterium]|nr:NAD(FAD)-utilizing dehydrogenase [Bacteroidia bacterium]